MSLYRLCPHCNNKTEYGTKCQCEIDIEKQRHKDYKASRTDKKEQEFYNTKQWLQTKEIAKSKTHGIDVYEYYVNGRVISGETVHHIVEIKEDWNKKLLISNLIYLTNSNHMYVHNMYNKSDKDKTKMQELLIELLDRFNKEFKDGGIVSEWMNILNITNVQKNM